MGGVDERTRRRWWDFVGSGVLLSSIKLSITWATVNEIFWNFFHCAGNYMRFPVRGATFFEDEPFERNWSLKPWWSKVGFSWMSLWFKGNLEECWGLIMVFSVSIYSRVVKKRTGPRTMKIYWDLGGKQLTGKTTRLNTSYEGVPSAQQHCVWCLHLLEKWIDSLFSVSEGITGDQLEYKGVRVQRNWICDSLEII